MIEQLRNLTTNARKRKEKGRLPANGIDATRARNERKSAIATLANRGLKSIRARLVVLALIVIAPLMVDRMRVLEETRAHRVSDIAGDAKSLARQGAHRQAEIVANTNALLHATARLYESEARQSGSCTQFLANATFAPWTKTIAVANSSGKIVCSSEPSVLGINIADRPYFQIAMASGGFSLSDYIIARGTSKPVIVAAHALHDENKQVTGVVLMSVNLQWLANLKDTVDGNSFASTLVVDNNGMLIAASEDIAGRIGRNFSNHRLVREMQTQDSGAITLDDFAGDRRIFAYTRIPDTRIHLAVGISEDKALRQIDRSIRNAYLQLLLILAGVLVGAWFSGEVMIMQPLRAFARTAARLGRGELNARVSSTQLPTEFTPLAKAFNDMAAQLAGREHGLVADNNRLTVLASLDAVSGLANRRGFDSRMDFEWMRHADEGRSLGLLMIDLDHFKQYNDTYGHPEGDACLRTIGTVLSEFSIAESAFAARYGGEEFLLLVPGADLAMMIAIGERLRKKVLSLNIAHSGSMFGQVTLSIGAAATLPDPATSPDTLVESADAGLYAAKGRGRNQVVGHEAIVHLAEADAPTRAAREAQPSDPVEG